MFSLSNQLYDPFEDFSSGFELLRPRRGEIVPTQADMLACDMHENASEFEAIFNVPGLTKDNVKIDLDERVLTVSADYKREEEGKDKKTKFHWKERSEGHAMRKIQLPNSVDLEKISAKQEHGVLTIHIPKVKSDEKKNVKSININ